MKKWAQQAALHYAVVNILKAIVLLVLLSHWLGCGFLALLRSDPHASEWMPQPCYASASDQYICGIYWAFGTLTSNVRPHSQAIQKVYDRTSFSESTYCLCDDRSPSNPTLVASVCSQSWRGAVVSCSTDLSSPASCPHSQIWIALHRPTGSIWTAWKSIWHARICRWTCNGRFGRSKLKSPSQSSSLLVTSGAISD